MPTALLEQSLSSISFNKPSVHPCRRRKSSFQQQQQQQRQQQQPPNDKQIQLTSQPQPKPTSKPIKPLFANHSTPHPLLIPDILLNIFHPFPHGDLTTLKSAVGVCKTWKQTIEPILYRTIFPYITDPAIKVDDRIRCKKPYPTQPGMVFDEFVRRLHLEGSNPLRHVRRLVLCQLTDAQIGMVMKGVTAIGGRLDSLTLRQCRVSKDIFQELRLQASHVRYLTLKENEIVNEVTSDMDIDIDVDTRSKSTTGHQLIEMFSRLQSLIIDDTIIPTTSTTTIDTCMISQTSLLSTIIKNNPTLTYLNVTRFKLFSNPIYQHNAIIMINNLQNLKHLFIPPISSQSFTILSEHHSDKLKSLTLGSSTRTHNKINITNLSTQFPNLQELHFIDQDLVGFVTNPTIPSSSSPSPSPILSRSPSPSLHLSISTSPLRILSMPLLTQGYADRIIRSFANTLEVVILPSCDGIPSSILSCFNLKVLEVMNVQGGGVQHGGGDIIKMVTEGCKKLEWFKIRGMDSDMMRGCLGFTRLKGLVTGWGVVGGGSSSMGGGGFGLGIGGGFGNSGNSGYGRVGRSSFNIDDVRYLLNGLSRLQCLEILGGSKVGNVQYGRSASVVGNLKVKMGGEGGGVDEREVLVRELQREFPGRVNCNVRRSKNGTSASVVMEMFPLQAWWSNRGVGELCEGY
ncbi:hypothetical protein HDU76_000086 [Blyttiomyces sp. JEL0837]|nr:hypothetical protein HDU76_000086 [Blyttiomyces sp. JEL0837]